MPRIELIGSNDTQQHYKASDIAELLSADKEQLMVGGDFMGRPDTCIYVNEHSVVKIRAELDLNDEKAKYWVNDILQKEREIAVHHPHKTWFLVCEEGRDLVVVGSICPRLQPLHILLKSAPETEQEQARYLKIMDAVFQLYFQLAKKTGFKLDEGLSNFAIDAQDTVYYLDDEYYTWDNFVAFAVMQGVFLRAYSWLNIAFIRQVAEHLVAVIDGIYHDPHCRVIISTQLQSLFMPSDEKQALVTEWVAVLSQSPVLKPSSTSTPLTAPSNPVPKKQSKNRFIAVMADIHANEAALDCVLDFYKQEGIQQGIVLGDIVGYGPDPSVCIEKIQDSPFEVIKGNHDHAAAMANTERGFSRSSALVIDWTIEQLDKSQREWLKYLPSFIENDDWFAVHGAPMDPSFLYGYVYVMTAGDNLDYMQDKGLSLCFHGHSHMPGIYARDEKGRDHHLTDKEIVLSDYKQLLVCPGSVGQPRNGKIEAQCAVYDQEEGIMSFIDIPYAVDPVAQRMKDYGLPDQLWQRLLTGK
ncbi:MAG: hypothetical protein GQ582_07355 [Methyloprofundus sp.]|nr:hypothetical protein [Methyloprofundus sp.]